MDIQDIRPDGNDVQSGIFVGEAAALQPGVDRLHGDLPAEELPEMLPVGGNKN